jgi:two-component system, response regulator
MVSMGKRMVILLVEDSEEDALMVKRAIHKSNLPSPPFLEVVGDGGEALDYLRKASRTPSPKNPQPDLVLLDLKLVKISGFEVLEAMKKDPYMKDLPTVVLTGSESDKDIDKAFALGAASYIIKPVGAERFVQVTKELGLI